MGEREGGGVGREGSGRSGVVMIEIVGWGVAPQDNR